MDLIMDLSQQSQMVVLRWAARIPIFGLTILRME